MKHQLILSTVLAGLLFITGCGSKDVQAPDVTVNTQTGQPAAQSAHVYAKEPALWLVQDEDTKVYLFGTVHLLTPETKWKNSRFENAFTASNAIYQEADVTSKTAQNEMMALIPSLAMYSDGRTLRGVLNAKDEKEVEEAAALVGVPMAGLDSFKPWFASMTLLQMQIMKKGYVADSGVDQVIKAKAKAAGKELRYFESATQQIKFMGTLSEANQVQLLVASAIAMEDDPDQLDRLVSDWASGNVKGIADVTEAEDWGDEAVYNVLLVNRNRNWVQKIEKLMDEEAGTFMVAVGAAHLAGEDSVIQMLRDTGETVVRQ